MDQNDNEKPRDFVEVRGKNKLIYLLDQYLDKRKVFIKGLPREHSASLSLIEPHNIIKLTFHQQLPDNYALPYEITVYTISRRYIEMTLKTLTFENNQGEFKFVKADIAQQIRQERRYSVEKENCLVENFKLSKYSITARMKTVPIAVQVSFDKFKEDVSSDISECSILTYETNLADKLVKASKKTRKIVYIHNIFEQVSSKHANTDFLDLKDFLGLTFNQEIKLLKKENIKSIMIYPIIYTNIIGEKIAVGYFRIASGSQPIPQVIINKLSQYAKAITDDIRDSTIQIVSPALKVVNVSKRGLQVLAQDKDVVDAFIETREEMLFEVKSDNLSVITLLAKTASISLCSDNVYNLGIQLIDGEINEGLEDWDQYILSLSQKIN